MNIPAEFGIQFLDWFKQRTEAYWADHQPRSLEDYTRSDIGGADWQRGTSWLDAHGTFDHTKYSLALRSGNRAKRQSQS